MKATIKQAETNERNLTIKQTDYGHWKIECDYRGKRISCTTNNSMAIDDYKSEAGEKNRYGENRIKSGYESLINEIIRSER